MKLDEHTTIWNHTAVKISDIRHIAMSPGETMEGYRLPASCFMYSTRGRASVALGGSIFFIGLISPHLATHIGMKMRERDGRPSIWWYN
ncbi:hypothetical protein J4772_16940 [Cohnella sp. LGH]|uniref:hypothetical protein n=1 Tax=Cohnella sp. LGH TaxID=1619153 RepID=UPI001ADBC97A|nr:hypothetical protein [Cohnella sp. LGH]QTH45963.1 hypothetical protein J4772_16940 [Cohnella sp. LGH]